MDRYTDRQDDRSVDDSRKKKKTLEVYVPGIISSLFMTHHPSPLATHGVSGRDYLMVISRERLWRPFMERASLLDLFEALRHLAIHDRWRVDT